MNVLIVTQYFWPENFRINDLALGLMENGINVTVLSTYPGYPNKKMYRNYPIDNYFNKIEVLRVPIVSRGNNKISLFLNYCSFVFSGIFLGLLKLSDKNFDIVFVFQPSPITSIIPGIFFSWFKKAKLAIWILDLWPDTLKPMGLLNFKYINKIAFLIANWIYQKGDLILCQSNSMSSLLKSRLPYKNIKYFPNWVEEELFKKFKKKKLIKHKPFNIIFAGNIGLAQDFDSILKAVELIPRNMNIQINIIGDGKEKQRLINKVHQKGLSEIIFFRNSVPLEKISEFLHEGNALILALKKAEIFEYTIPGKLQSYLAIGLPIVSMLSGESAQIIEENQLGLNATSGDYKNLADNIIKLKKMKKIERDMMGKKCKEFAIKYYKRDKIINNFINEINLL